MKHLESASVRGLAWSSSGQFFSRLLGLGRLVILARILSPSDFGLFALALVPIGLIETLSQTGLAAALVNEKSLNRRMVDVTWTTGLLRGGIICICCWVTAPFVAAYFRAPEIADLTRAGSLGILVASASNSWISRLQKDLAFASLQILTIGPASAEILVSLLSAFIRPSPWALVHGYLAGKFAGLGLSYALALRRPKLYWNTPIFFSLFRFGRWIQASSLLIYALDVAAESALGRISGASAVGSYQIAFRIPNLIATSIAHPVVSVFVPAFTLSRSNREVTLRLFQTAVGSIATFFLPILLIVGMFSSNWVVLLFGEKWRASAFPMSILCIFGLLRILNALLATAYQGLGDPASNSLHTAIQFLAVVLVLAFSDDFTPITAALLVTGGAAIFFSMSILRLGARTCLNAQDLLRSCIKPAVAGGAMALLFYSCPIILPALPWGGCVLAGLTTYISILALLVRSWDAPEIGLLAPLANQILARCPTR